MNNIIQSIKFNKINSITTILMPSVLTIDFDNTIEYTIKQIKKYTKIPSRKFADGDYKAFNLFPFYGVSLDFIRYKTSTKRSEIDILVDDFNKDNIYITHTINDVQQDISLLDFINLCKLTSELITKDKFKNLYKIEFYNNVYLASLVQIKNERTTKISLVMNK